MNIKSNPYVIYPIAFMIAAGAEVLFSYYMSGRSIKDIVCHALFTASGAVLGGLLYTRYRKRKTIKRNLI